MEAVKYQLEILEIGVSVFEIGVLLHEIYQLYFQEVNRHLCSEVPFEANPNNMLGSVTLSAHGMWARGSGNSSHSTGHRRSWIQQLLRL